MADAVENVRTRSIVKLNNANSIKGYVLEDQMKLKSNTRFVGSKLLTFAKIFITDFVHEVIKVFHELTIKSHVKEMLSANLIEEVSYNVINRYRFSFISIFNDM